MIVDIYTTDKKYNVIYADPPWKYKTWTEGGGTAEKRLPQHRQHKRRLSQHGGNIRKDGELLHRT